jgi:hypothetical protein
MDGVSVHHSRPCQFIAGEAKRKQMVFYERTDREAKLRSNARDATKRIHAAKEYMALVTKKMNEQVPQH